MAAGEATVVAGGGVPEGEAEGPRRTGKRAPRAMRRTEPTVMVIKAMR